MIYGRLTWPCTTCKRPSVLMEKTNMDTVRSFCAALTSGPLRGAPEAVNALDVQEDIENHTRVKNRSLIEFNRRQTNKDCRLHVQIKRRLAHNIVLNHLWERESTGEPGLRPLKKQSVQNLIWFKANL